MDNNNMESADTLHPIDSVIRSVFLEEFTSIGIDIAEKGIY